MYPLRPELCAACDVRKIVELIYTPDSTPRRGLRSRWGRVPEFPIFDEALAPESRICGDTVPNQSNSKTVFGGLVQPSVSQFQENPVFCVSSQV